MIHRTERRPAASPRLLLAAILAVCILVRGGYVLYLVDHHPEVTVEGDTASYERPARALLEDGRFNHDAGDDQPEFLRTPGYPGFIAAVHKVFGGGDEDVAVESDLPVLLAQVVVSALTVLLVYLIASRLWSTPVGVLAAALTTLEPLQSYASGTLVTETLGTFLLVLFAGAGVVAFTRSAVRPRWLFLAGLALALATMVRPVTYYLPALVVVLVIDRLVREPADRRRAAAGLAAFLVPLVVIVGGWQLRNHERVDSWRLSGIEAKNLYLFRAAGVVAERDRLSFAEAQHRMRVDFGPVGTEPQGSYYGRMHRQGSDILKENPATTIELTIRGLISEVVSVNLKPFAYLNMKPASGPMELAAFVGLLAFYVVALHGVRLALRSREHLRAHLLVLGVVAYIVAVSAGPEAFGGRGERFRAPIVPLLILYAALGAHDLATRRRQRNSPPRVEGSAEWLASGG